VDKQNRKGDGTTLFLFVLSASEAVGNPSGLISGSEARASAIACLQRLKWVTISARQPPLTLEQAGFIKRQPRVARSIEPLVDPGQLPELL